MNKKLAREIEDGFRQAGAILRGAAKPSRVTRVDADRVDVKKLRERMDMSQSQFAAMLGVSIDTLQNWEQNRRQPKGPAHSLLLVAKAYPREVAKVAARKRMIRNRPLAAAHA